jgi:DNA-binding transcriptional MerR regulator
MNVSVDTAKCARLPFDRFARSLKPRPRTRVSTIAESSANMDTVVSIPEKLFFKIGEVCQLAGVQAHVLRYWESEFPMLAPQKNRAGQRTYRRRDVEMALRIRQLLYDEQYTIAGAKKKLASDMRAPSREAPSLPPPKPPTRSLQPPPSLAAKFGAHAAEPNTESSSGQGRATLLRIAEGLREILDLLEQGDEAIKAARAKR